MNHCKPPCRDKDRCGEEHRWQEGDQGQWKSIDPSRSSYGSCWAYGQDASGDMQKDAAADYGQAAAYDYGREGVRDVRQDTQAQYWQEPGMTAQQNAFMQQGYAANWSYSQNGAWPYYQ